jgi:MoxR-like ATPase
MDHLMNKNAKAFIEAAEKLGFTDKEMSRDDIAHVVQVSDVSYPYWFVTKSEYRVAKGVYKLPKIGGKVYSQKPTQTESAPDEQFALAAQVLSFKQPKLIDESDSTVPALFPDYVPFGFYKDLSGIIKSKLFYPVFITGLSGNGKTLMVEQVCANLKRECLRVNISIETDETDLLGGYSLIDGNTLYRDGPVIQAMKKGAVLLIDEVDRGSNKLMCMQGIMEGKPYYNKKTGEMVYPAPGFNVIATANTKGRGSDEGKFLSQILDDAFLERFPITVEQEYPDARTEKKILKPLIKDEKFVDNLVKWADVVRQSYAQGATDEIISTRRLVHIAKAFEIFNDRLKAIQLCVNRFEEETKTAFIDLYTKVDAEVSSANTVTVTTEESEKSE